jgi:hypothetical protein
MGRIFSGISYLENTAVTTFKMGIVLFNKRVE